MSSRTDIILPMRDPYMGQIIDGSKNYEFRKYRLKSGIHRIWFYRTAPYSVLIYVFNTFARFSLPAPETLATSR